MISVGLIIGGKGIPYFCELLPAPGELFFYLCLKKESFFSLPPIPTENGDERLDCACAATVFSGETITGLNLSFP